MRSLFFSAIFFFKNTACFWICLFLLSSCSQVKNIFTYPRHNEYSKTKPFLFETSIELNGGQFTSDERNGIKQRLLTQLDDSAKVIKKDKFFVFHPVVKPPVYDTAYSNRSARNMKFFLLHLGYYGAKSSVVADTVKFSKEQQRVSVKYIIDAGPPTLIDTFSYNLKDSTLQKLALQTKKQSHKSQ